MVNIKSDISHFFYKKKSQLFECLNYFKIKKKKQEEKDYEITRPWASFTSSSLIINNFKPHLFNFY